MSTVGPREMQMSDRVELLALFTSAAPGSVGRTDGTWAALVDAVVAAGWRVPAVVLTSIEQLDSVADHTVVTDRDGGIWGVNERREWCELSTVGLGADEILHWGPFTVVAGPGTAPRSA